MMQSTMRQSIQKGMVIPASPLALNAQRRLDERRQRALWRYYIAAGVGGIAVGVHSTQFAIRDPKVGLHRSLLELAADEQRRASRPVALIGGICGKTEQAIAEAEMIRECGFTAGMLSLGAMKDADDDMLIDHCRRIADIVPLFGFYLQPASGGRLLSYGFWRRFAEIENVVAIKMAPFNRYQTIDVMRAVAESGRDDIAMYTGNDDNIVIDLLTPYQFQVDGKQVRKRIVGGLLGHWAVWTKQAVQLVEECQKIADGIEISRGWLVRNVQVTDSNAAFFDAANGYAGCIAGLHEVLRRQGLFEGVWLLDPNEGLSPGQMEEIDRVYRAYPHLNDDTFVAEHLDEWLGN
jgi:hypothetical protein